MTNNDSKPSSNNHSKEFVSLRDYLEAQMQAHTDIYSVKFENIEKSTALAYASLNKRLEGMNEFRESLKDQANKFVTDEKFQFLMTKVDEDIRILREAKAAEEGKASQKSVNTALVIGVVGLIIAIASTLLGFFGT